MSFFLFFFSFSRYKVLLDEQEHPVQIVKQQLQRYGEETKVVNPFVMHVDFIINYTMWVLQTEKKASTQP